MCGTCETTFPALPDGGVDFRLQRSLQRQVSLNIGSGQSDHRPPVKHLKQVGPSACRNDLEAMPPRMYKEVVACFPRPVHNLALMLDLGCGGMTHREVVERQGFQYVGLDYAHPRAMFAGDAQSLPFKEGSFEFVLSIAVLQEVPHPEAMIHEACRVLTPGGRLIGSASYLESYFSTYSHYTHLGLDALLRQGGFIVDAISPNHHWTVPVSLLRNALFPSLPLALATALVSPGILFHRLWWRFGGLANKRATEQNRLLLTTGSFFFFAHKPLS
jgi:SAM-dependent methyltransferase